MKNDIENIKIEPNQRYIDFIGPPKSNAIDHTLDGHVKLTVSKPVKIRGMVMKFKGYGRVCLKNMEGAMFDLSTNLLPEIKTSLLAGNKKPFQLSVGEHRVPWNLYIPNVYPRSFQVKRASIHYKVEVVISFGLPKKTITREYPITVLRHILPYKELSPKVGSRVYCHTIPDKFKYEIECPRIISLEQESMPVAVKYLCTANQKPVVSIRTQLLQIEFYRCETIPKSDKDVQLNVSGRRLFEAMETNPKCVKFTRRKGPVFVHLVENNPVSAWKRPVLLRHELGEPLTHGVESALVSVYHQLEIVFQFGHKYDAICAKVPIIITSLPFTKTMSLPPVSPMMNMLPINDTIPKYCMERLPHFIPPRITGTVDKKTVRLNRIIPTDTSSGEMSSYSFISSDTESESSIVMDIRQRATSAEKNTKKSQHVRFFI
ncbi:hypothetical protein BJV82DRAFT_629060 [Fennellomyces sp. T-0311]|nr:hypothetical protein BJV82DRAFT_629060 [Fennellomyces sp. T-0311]